MNAAARSYDFPYAPVRSLLGDDDGDGDDFVVATSSAVAPDRIESAIESECGSSDAATLLQREPLFWTRVRASRGARRSVVADALRRAGIPVRYVASAVRESMALPPPLSFDGAPPLEMQSWRVRDRRSVPLDGKDGLPGRWFLRGDAGGGVAVDRRRCGTGQATRLAVIDDDAADLERLELDAVVLVLVDRAPRASGHGALLVGWATGAATYEGTYFEGVAPDAAARVYLVPRPGADVAALPLAIARAVIDGADVVLCATYVEGTTSPMLDDALELAARVGRCGRGCAVVFPTGRETSSVRRSLHASLSLGFGDPASDPRVFCIAPAARDGGWFLWKEQHGKWRPFANRGPSVRWMAPGDDLSHPFFEADRLFHAESSGAAAIAAGVLLLVLGVNPFLRLAELGEIVTRFSRTEAAAESAARDLADRADALPAGRDRDGHDAKRGYGLLDATRACLAAADPVALELLSMGEDRAAAVWADDARAPSDAVYSVPFARWAVRALLANPAAAHAFRAVARHSRLLAADPARAHAHARGALARHLALLLRSLPDRGPAPSPIVRAELDDLEGMARNASVDALGAPLEAALLRRALRAFAPTPTHLLSAPQSEAIQQSSTAPRPTSPGISA